jgi:hypothetical protein
MRPSSAAAAPVSPPVPAPSPTEPAEPRHVAEYFERDPEGAALAAQIAAVIAAAKAGAAGGTLEAEARAVLAAEVVAYDAAADETVMGEFTEARARSVDRVTEAPARNLADLATRLAVLVRHLLGAAQPGALDETSGATLALAAAALSDAVLLRSGPLALPAGAGVPIGGPDDVARWRRLAAAAG